MGSAVRRRREPQKEACSHNPSRGIDAAARSRRRALGFSTEQPTDAEAEHESRIESSRIAVVDASHGSHILFLQTGGNVHILVRSNSYGPVRSPALQAGPSDLP
jgi:hypothetical protein